LAGVPFVNCPARNQKGACVNATEKKGHKRGLGRHVNENEKQ